MSTFVAVLNIALALFGVIVLMKHSIRERIGNWVSQKRVRIWIFPVIFLSSYSLFALGAGKWQLLVFGLFSLYLIFPTAIFSITGPKNSTENKWKDFFIGFAVILLLWLPVEILFSQKYLFGQTIIQLEIKPKVLAYLWLALMAMIYILAVFTGWRKLDLHCDWPVEVKIPKSSYRLRLLKFWNWQWEGKIQKHDLLLLAGFVLILAIYFIPIILGTKFARFGFNKDFQEKPWLMPLLFVCMFFAPALVEELIFRGVIQNLFKKVCDPMLSIILTSMLFFGYAHINNSVRGYKVPNWTYVLLATIAGLGYGYVYERTKSLLIAALLHLIVDFVWLMLLKG